MKQQRREESDKGKEERRLKKRKNQKKQDAGARIGRKVAKHCFFQCFVARQVGLLKRRVRSHLVRWEMKNCTLVWREEHFKVKMAKANYSRSTFGSWAVEKVHATVRQSKFRSQKCTKHTFFGALLEVQMLTKCKALWRKTCLEVNMLKNRGFGALLSAEMFK